MPEVALPDGDPVHLPALLVEQLGVGSTSEARRLIEQGGVKLNGEPAPGLDLPREALAGALLQVGKRRFARLTRLGRTALYFPGRPSGRRRKVPVTRPRSLLGPTRIRYDSFPTEASGASRRLFFAVSQTRHRSLKTQQRTFFDTSRPRIRRPASACSRGGRGINLVGPSEPTFEHCSLEEHKLEVKGLPAGFFGAGNHSSRRV